MRQKRLTERRNVRARSSKSDNSLLVIHLEKGNRGTCSRSPLTDMSRGPIASGSHAYIHMHTIRSRACVQVIAAQYVKNKKKNCNVTDTRRDNDFIGAASSLLLLVRQTRNVITKRGLAVEMGLTKREESELHSGWPARVSRPIAFLFMAFYHATRSKTM